MTSAGSTGVLAGCGIIHVSMNMRFHLATKASFVRTPMPSLFVQTRSEEVIHGLSVAGKTELGKEQTWVASTTMAGIRTDNTVGIHDAELTVIHYQCKADHHIASLLLSMSTSAQTVQSPLQLAT